MSEPKLGWISPDQRTRDQHEAHDRCMAAMPQRFALTGAADDSGPFLNLMELWRHERLKQALGGEFTGVYQQTGSCFPKGVPVRMADGSEKPVEEVKIGDEVVTHTGSKRRVVHTMSRRYTGEMITVQVQGFAFPLTMTADHRVAVVDTSGRTVPRWPCDEMRHDLRWVRADELQANERMVIGWSREESAKSIDLLELLSDSAIDGQKLMNSTGENFGQYSRASALRQAIKKSGRDVSQLVWLWKSRYKNAIRRHIAITESFARFMGLYLAEGGVHEGRATFTYSAAERDTLAAETIDLARGIFGIEGKIKHEPDKGRTTVRFANKTLCAVLKSLVPDNIYSKRIPPVFFDAPLPIRAALVCGWLAGDGYYKASTEKKDARIQGVTVSKNLARDMTTMALSVGYKATCSKRRSRNQSREAWDVYLSGGAAHVAVAASKGSACDTTIRQPKGDSHQTPFGYARPVKLIEKQIVESLQVYDFEVEEDHSFIAGGLVVHNCVGAGGGNVLMSLVGVEIITNNEREEIILPFWLYPYGKSRELLGDRSEGEGSLGSAFADACKRFGLFGNHEDGLPKPQTSGGAYVWVEREEMRWSNGAAAAPKWVELGKNHLVRTTAPLRSAKEIRDSLANGYPVTFACNNYCGPRGARVQGSGENACTIGAIDTYGPHQTSYQAYWDHPQFGLLFWNENQWARDTYPRCPKIGKGSGCWNRADDVDRAIRSLNAEVFSFSSLDGYPARTIRINWAELGA